MFKGVGGQGAPGHDVSTTHSPDRPPPHPDPTGQAEPPNHETTQRRAREGKGGGRGGGKSQQHPIHSLVEQGSGLRGDEARRCHPCPQIHREYHVSRTTLRHSRNDGAVHDEDSVASPSMNHGHDNLLCKQLEQIMARPRYLARTNHYKISTTNLPQGRANKGETFSERRETRDNEGNHVCILFM